MNTLIEQVLEWGIEKGITGPNGKGTRIAQTCKFLEEVTETVTAVLKNDTAEIKDGIGDTQVTLILLCEMYGWRIEDIVREEIFYKKVILPLSGQVQALLANESAVKVLFGVVEHNDSYLREEIGYLIKKLVRLASCYSWTLQECLQTAYDVISKRKGEMVDGSFVRDKELNPVVCHDLDDDLDESPLPVQHNDCPDDPIDFHPESGDFYPALGKACVLGDTVCESYS